MNKKIFAVIACCLAAQFCEAALFSTCQTQDFGIAYNGERVFSVSSLNNTCSCPFFAGNGSLIYGLQSNEVIQGLQRQICNLTMYMYWFANQTFSGGSGSGSGGGSGGGSSGGSSGSSSSTSGSPGGTMGAISPGTTASSSSSSSSSSTGGGSSGGGGSCNNANSCPAGYYAAGYYGNGDPTCYDVNECTVYTPGLVGSICRHGTCVNSIGGYSCICDNGWTQDAVGHCTVDVDECVLNTTICGQHRNSSICENTIGSYNCSCKAGYTKAGPQWSAPCVDVNECTLFGGICNTQATCYNLPGTYNCTCNEGYAGNGVTNCSRTCEAGTMTFNNYGTGCSGSIQTYTLPACVTTLVIDARGAQGGGSGSQGTRTGGLGARMVGTFAVTGGSTVSMLVGQVGPSATSYSGCGGGGGGGTFVRIDSTLLVAAGGGGGAMICNYNTAIGGNGGPGLTTTSGGSSGPGMCTNNAVAATAGGANGAGGLVGYGGYGGGGGGYTGAGGSQGGAGGQAFTSGGSGACTGQPGGYGGGGGGNNGCCGSAGGGGGYSGGAGGNECTPAGGGGSYNAGTSQSNTAGFQSGHGQVVLSWS